MSNVKNFSMKACIKLPKGNATDITQAGDVVLANGLVLAHTLVVPVFKFNLLSVSKLTQDNDCILVFCPGICLIKDCATRKLRGIGKLQAGLYYLVNKAADHLNKDLVEFWNKLLVCIQP